RTLLQESYHLLQTQAERLTDEQRQDFARTLARLEILANDPDLLRQMALVTAETLLSVWQVEEQLRQQTKRTETLAELLNQAADQQRARFESLERTLHRRPLADRYAGREVASRVEKLVQEYAAQPFVGREDALTQLNDFLTKNRSGRLTITARAGFGK